MLKMKRVAIDMDDVLADTTVKIIKTINSLLNKNYTYQELMENNHSRELFLKDYLANNSFLWKPGFFLDVPVKSQAIETVKKLSEKYEIFIVSAATEFPESLKEKLIWMKQHFPFISWTHIVFCGHKYMIHADYLIDDHEKNLKSFLGTPLLFTAPHNLHINEYQRVDTWDAVSHLLL
jgi:5'-nucleotidase